jgi:protein gp37
MTGSYWDHVLNICIGCDPASTGCDYCFAPPAAWIRKSNPNEDVAAAFAGTVKRTGDGAQWTGKVNLLPERFDQVFRRRKPTTYYLTLLGDIFHAEVTREFLAYTFAVCAVTPRHWYLNTTKRHARMRSLTNDPAFRGEVAAQAEQLGQRKGATPWDGTWPIPNLALAVSVENQTAADLRIPALIQSDAAVRWVSVEPLLDLVDLTRIGRGSRQQPDLVWDVLGRRHGVPGRWQEPLSRGLDWVVTGGESNSPRAVHPDHVRALRDACVAAGVPFWFKQWGDFLPLDVVDRPEMCFGRAFNYSGWHAIGVREPGPTGTMRTATFRPLEVGERNRGGVLLSRDIFAKKVGAKEAGRQLDSREWNEKPEALRV